MIDIGGSMKDSRNQKLHPGLDAGELYPSKSAISLVGPVIVRSNVFRYTYTVCTFSSK